MRTETRIRRLRFTERFAYAHAHHLPTFPDGHKCRRVHGHLNEVTITIEVATGSNGYAFDHAELDKVGARVLGPLDHALINTVTGLEDGLAETQLAWLVPRFAAEAERLGGRLIAVDLDEWSSGGNYRLVKHRKSWALHRPGLLRRAWDRVRGRR
jgi:6-pyruvoyltetrahydropterin/6-carboxytetrahydropterin synthase